MSLLAAFATGTAAFLAVGLLLGHRFDVHMPTPPSTRLDGTALVAGSCTFMVAWALTGAWPVAVVPALVVAALPGFVALRRRLRRVAALREAWPDALRNLAADLAAGRSLPQALDSLAGPGPLGEVFARYPANARMLGVPAALALVKEDLADATSDRVVEVLVLAHARGGSSVRTIVLQLADGVASDLRTLEEIRNAELEQKINARAVFVLPWLVLAVLTIQSGPIRDFYGSGAGTAVVVVGAVMSLAGFGVVSRLGREPVEPRVFGSGHSS